jgi:capsular exopolysaccharide synthesis family protein
LALKSTGSEYMDLRRILQVLKRHVLVVLACVIVGGLASAFYTSREDRLYESSAEIFVAATSSREAETGLGSNDLVQSRLSSYTQLVSTPRVEALIRTQLAIPEGQPVASSITATVVPGSVLLSITVTDPDPQHAADVANSAAANLSTVVNELESLGTDKEGSSTVLTAVTRAATPTSNAVSPVPSRNLALGIGLGLLIGVAVAGLRELLDRRFRSVEELVETSGLTLLGVVPADRSFGSSPDVILDAPQSLSAERFRQIRTNLRYAAVDSPPKTIAVVSSVPSEGKSLSAINLASALAQGDASVILVDADLRRPAAAKYLGLESRPGLTEVLLGDLPYDDALRTKGGMSVLPSGTIPPNPADLLASHQMRALLTKDLSQADYVVIDCPPLLPVTDAATLAAQVDAVVFVVGMDRASRDDVRRSMEMLRAVDARVLGVIANRVKGSNLSDAYSYLYTYESKGQSGRRRAKKRRGRPSEAATPQPAETLSE